VTVGDVDLWLLTGGVALEDVHHPAEEAQVLERPPHPHVADDVHWAAAACAIIW
jgi:hypothetical protein